LKLNLRPYQLKCVEAVFKQWETVTSTLVVMPTGTGKSKVFSEIVRRMAPKRSIVIAHRGELITQAARHVSECGLDVQIEMADQQASTDFFHKSPVVVASVQTLISGKKTKRMEKFDPHDFGLLVVDEFHHGTAASYRAIIDHFRKNPDLKVFGCTATPDRADEEALGQIVDSVAYDYEIVDAIQDGWLVPIEQHMVRIKSLDYSHVRTTAGDLNGADLAVVMEDEKNLQGMCAATIEVIKMRKTIVFTSSVRHAEMCAEIFNRHRPGMAMWISGKTPDNERALLLKDFAEGRIQVLVNVGIATEGFDVPGIECVVMGRPTKSRALYTQMAGRATRPLAGVLDEMHSAYERREAIATSPKPAATILDFVGNSGRHKLMTTLDILGGKFSDEAKEVAVKKALESDGAVRVQDLLEESEEEIRKRIEEQKRQAEARRLRLIAKADYHIREVNPFDGQDRLPGMQKGWDNLKGLSIISQYVDRLKNGLATAGQCDLLKRYGYNTKGLTMKQATQLIESVKNNGWKRPPTKVEV
jgi:superfamily II DNA or RNA helicase